jgi:anti-sigma28 factor (negative regulator of flagellin synthesis)
MIVVLLLVLAGCSGVGGPANTNESTATTAPTAATETTATETTSTTVPELDSVDYAELSPVERRAFDRAVQGEAVFVPGSVATSDSLDDSYFSQLVAGVFRVNDYVRKDGVLYRLNYEETGGPLVASYTFQATESQPTGNETAVDFEAIPSRAKEPVRSAIENGSYEVPAGKWSAAPEGLRDRHVRYNGSVYRINIAVGDEFSDVLRAEKIE